MKELSIVATSELTVFVDIAVGKAEMIISDPEICQCGESHTHTEAFYLVFYDIDGRELKSVVPVHSPLGTAILEGDLEISCRNTLGSLDEPG